MDEVDIAQHLEEQHLKRSLDIFNNSKRDRESALTCRVCGVVIPQGRREAIPGVETCAQHGL
ncbi:hypothetical protein [Terasakiella pusilla]|uniref:hypothetical protein n=1 Tax=Terasakiella pusilla TaxID=64973 RepID=UPI003AA9AED7